jgi:hypothetical protein
MLEDRFAQQSEIVDKFHDPSADYQMKVYDLVLRPSASPATGAITITLPSVSEAKGGFYSIVARDADGTNTITIQDKDDSEAWAGDYTLNGVGDKILLYSDGLTWQVVSLLTYTSTTAAPTTLAPTTAG